MWDCFDIVFMSLYVSLVALDSVVIYFDLRVWYDFGGQLNDLDIVAIKSKK